MSGAAFLWVLLVGVALDRLWLHREAVGAWLEELLDDPPPPPPVATPLSHVRTVRFDDDGGEA